MSGLRPSELGSRLRSGGRPLWVRALGYWAYRYKATWRSSLTTSFVEPLLYLAAMGVGLGSLVDRHVQAVGGVSYLSFVAPGLLASAAMQVGANESTWPVMGAIKWDRSYHTMLSTPLRVGDVLGGHLAWVLLRLFMVSAIFLGVIAGFGLARSPEAALALPASMLCGLAFATPIAAFAATQEKDAGFSVIYRFMVVPMFLFSGVFYPISRLPGWLEPVALATPLYHGVALCRSLVLGGAVLGPSLAHAAYLAALSGAGCAAARSTYRRRLVR